MASGPGTGLAASTGWERAIEPGRADGRLVAESFESARTAEGVEIPATLAPELAAALPASGIEALYSHQLEALEAAAGENVIVTSGTASGKSLSFNLPVLDQLVRDDGHRALYLYPTKALAQDQARKLSALGLSQLRHAIYDGDTPREERPQIRRRSNLILTNPDMLHVGILPHHKGWGDFLARLGLGGRGRGPHLPRRVRLARRQRPAPPAPGREPVRRQPPVRPRLGHDRQPGGARGAAGRRALPPGRFGWGAHGQGGGSGSGTRRSSTSGR